LLSAHVADLRAFAAIVVLVFHVPVLLAFAPASAVLLQVPPVPGWSSCGELAEVQEQAVSERLAIVQTIGAAAEVEIRPSTSQGFPAPQHAKMSITSYGCALGCFEGFVHCDADLPA
jgi:hypothetical protein